jgi:hypothetical protein
MSITIKTKYYMQLVASLKKEITTNKIKLWELDEDGHITLTSDKYYKKAWFNPELDSKSGEVTFRFIKPKNAKENQILYGDYHMHLLKMLLVKYYKRYNFEAINS